MSSPQPPDRSPLLRMLLAAAIMLAFSYLAARTILVAGSQYRSHEKALALLLLGAECFIVVHGITYVTQILRVVLAKGAVDRPEQRRGLPPDPPSVAVVVASYREPLEVLEATLTSFYNLTYPNKRLYLLDDTRYDMPGADREKDAEYRKAVEDLCRRFQADLFRHKWHGAKAGILNDFLAFRAGERREGFLFLPLSGRPDAEAETYITVFDADQNPFPDFLDDLVAMCEADPRMAFVQTPQFYTNTESNRVARAAGLQQTVFYEYICEGKGLRNAMMCCGTNVLFRRAALMDVGGFDEDSVTEDFATSLKFHMRGWRSAYYGRPCAFGMGPEDLGGYFKQQFRWALGTVGQLRRIVPAMLRQPRALAAGAWWEYLTAASYYLVGLVFLVVALCPPLYILARVPTFFLRPEIYAAFFAPYFALSLFIFLWTLTQRNYSARDLFMGQVLITASFPVYAKAAIMGLAGIKGRFVVTPKTAGAGLPLRALWPQIAMVLVNAVAIVWGVNRLYYEREMAAAVGVNMFWCAYHAAIVSSVFCFNRPAKSAS